MSQLHVEAEGVTDADPEVVWSLVADANSYSSWGPWSDCGYQPASQGPSRKGSVQWFRYGRRTTSVEEILEADEPRRLVYGSGSPWPDIRLLCGARIDLRGAIKIERPVHDLERGEARLGHKLREHAVTLVFRQHVE